MAATDDQNGLKDCELAPFKSFEVLASIFIWTNFSCLTSKN